MSPRGGPAAWESARRALTERWYDEGFYSDATLWATLVHGADRHPSTRVVFETGRGRHEVALGRALDDAARVATALHRLGVRAGDVVAVQLPNRPETLTVYAAVARLGATILPIVHIYGPVETGYIVAEACAKVLIVPDALGSIDFLDRLDVMRRPPTLEHLVVVGDHAPGGAHRFAELTAVEPEPVTVGEAQPDDRAILLYTSGTTAAPKGVQHSHNSFLTELRTSPTPPPGVASTVNLQPFPAGHIAGLTALLGPFVHGYPTILLETWDVTAAAALIEEHGVTAMAGTPFHIAGLLDHLGPERARSVPLQHVVTGGAGVPAALVERAGSVGWNVSRCYGSSEQPTVSASRATDALHLRAMTDGEPLPGNEIRVADDGEIVTIGPDQFLGYTDAALNAQSFTADGWFRTGDIGVVEEDRLTITDRKKDIIIRGGENISSSEVEAVLATHDAVMDAAVVAVPDDRYGERVGAFVVLRPGGTLDLDGVRALFRAAGVARQKTPEHLVAVDELPRTPAGKVKKHELRAALTPAPAPAPHSGHRAR